ncbi:MAG: hypothetical protein HYX85_01310 [Chloroflexi bacterium]|nr:hypothetical protein [Chloroflexota bacterium]
MKAKLFLWLSVSLLALALLLVVAACAAKPVPTAPTPTPAPAPAPAAPAPTPVGIPQIPHSLEGRSDCLTCHKDGLAGAPKVPADHAGRTSEMCRACHQPKS